MIFVGLLLASGATANTLSAPANLRLPIGFPTSRHTASARHPLPPLSHCSSLLLSSRCGGPLLTPRCGDPHMSGAAASWVAGCVFGGTLGTPFVVGAVKTWYRKIALPTWTPPDRIFAPVWTSLYAMMGLATARVAASSGITSAPVLHFLSHLCVNVLWAPVFFGMQRLRFALYMNVGLTASLAVLLTQYRAAVGTACALLLAPYMGWLLFATALNFRICTLNPTRQSYNNARWQADLAKLQLRAASLAAA